MRVHAKLSKRIEKNEDKKIININSLEEFEELKKTYNYLLLFDDEGRKVKEYELIEIENKYDYFDDTKYLPIRYTEYEGNIIIRELDNIFDGVPFRILYDGTISFKDKSYKHNFYIRNRKIQLEVENIADNTYSSFDIYNKRVVDFNIRELALKLYNNLVKYIEKSKIREELKDILLKEKMLLDYE